MIQLPNANPLESLWLPNASKTTCSTTPITKNGTSWLKYQINQMPSPPAGLMMTAPSDIKGTVHSSFHIQSGKRQEQAHRPRKKMKTKDLIEPSCCQSLTTTV